MYPLNHWFQGLKKKYFVMNIMTNNLLGVDVQPDPRSLAEWSHGQGDRWGVLGS